jgi:hypothetical protein
MLTAAGFIAFQVGALAAGCALETGGSRLTSSEPADASPNVVAADAPSEADAPLPVMDAGPQVVTKSDPSWHVADGGSAVLVDASCIPSVWITVDAGASWIWSSPCSATDDDSKTFSNTFDLSALSFAELNIAVDNYAFVRINGQSLPTSCTVSGTTTPMQAVACTHTTINVIDVTRYLKIGTNNINIDVHNVPLGTTPPWGNPAGLLTWISAK